MPLDTALPPGRLDTLLADACFGLVQVNAGGAERLKERVPKLLVVESDPDDANPGGPQLSPAPGQTAYLIYTSSSTV